ncbi:hypothetical protein EYV94_06920 [Puteibacter caeruleilacunae]|nr:hypothetical protein EYV94_06920 [Puteibacter caeruleilacunae]
MFFLGLFSTYLPYLILAIIYLVGYGAYAYNVEESDLDLLDASKQIVLDVNLEQASLDQTATYQYSDFKSKIIAEVNGVFEYFILSQLCLEKITPIWPKVGQTCNGYSYQLYSRPPPFMA